MAVILPPAETSTPISSGGISPSSALAVGGTGAAIGLTQLGEAARAEASAAKQTADMSQQFFDEAKAATDTARYSSAMNEAIVKLTKAKQDRYNRQIDDAGNPTFESLSSDIIEIGRGISEEITKNIYSAEVLNKFNQSFSGLMSNTQIEALSEARRQQDSYVRSQVDQSFKTLGDMAATGSPIDATAGIGEYSRQLNTLVQNGALTMEDAGKKLDMFVSNVSELRLNRLIEASPEVALAALSPDADPNGLRQEGILLNEEQRQKYGRHAQLAVNNKIRIAQATEAARLDSIKDVYKETNQIIERGGTPDPNVMQILKTASAGTQFSVNVADLEDKAQRVSIFNSLSNVEREAVLNKIKASGQLNDDFQMFSRINDNLVQAQQKDLFSFAISQNIIKQPDPIDINGNLAPQLASRRQAISLIKGHYGQLTTGLTNEETAQLAASINNLPIEQKTAKLGQVVAGLGSSTPAFLSKVAQNGDRVLANVGVLVVNGRKDTATKVLIGQQFMQDQQLKLAPTFGKNAAYDTEKALPSISNPAFQNDIINMAKAIYAVKSVEQKDYSQVYNSDRWQESIKEVVGGEALSINPPGKSWFSKNYTIVPPVKGMDEKGFTDWTASITDKEIQQLGGWQGWNSGMSDRIKLATFEQVGFGRYVVQLPSELSDSGYTPVMDKNGRPFIIDYDAIQDLRAGNTVPVAQVQQASNFRVEDIFKTIVRPTKLPPVTDGDNIDNIAEAAANKHGVPADLVKAVIQQESGGNHKAVSKKGASGLMQLMPGTAKQLGVTDLFDPHQNVDAGTKYLGQLLKRYNGDVPKALAAYNAGPAIVDKVGGVPNWKETKQYVKNITSKIKRA